MTDKPENRKIIESHYLHKEAKLRTRLETDALERRKLETEMTELEKENRDNFVFSLADGSLPASEHEHDQAENITVESHSPPYRKFD